MIVFKYEVGTVADCHLILNGMNIPGRAIEVSMNEDTKAVWESDEFIGLFNEDNGAMELYGTKNTNSINFFINRYKDLDWDTWYLVKTKRW